MKLPKTFLPEKSFENKIRQLVQEDGEYSIDQEAYTLFFKFVCYLKTQYKFLSVCKVSDKPKKYWTIAREDFTGSILDRCVGSIESFLENDKEQHLVYGYKARIAIKEESFKLIYREGYIYYYDGKDVYEKNPARCDGEEEIPFP